MKKLIICLVALLASFSSNSQHQLPEGEAFCQLLLKMYDEDQKYRVLLQDPFFAILDSIKKVEDIDNKTYASFPREKQLAYGKKARAIADKVKARFTEKQSDSLMSLQIELDNKNTELLIDIIKQRGWPNKENTKCKKFAGGVFRHSQSQYFDEIRVLIEKEMEEGRMNTAAYKFYLDHINGRKGYGGTSIKN